MGRFVRGQQPEDDAYRHRTAERKDDGRSGDVGREGEERSESHESETERDPYRSTEERQHDGFGEELYDDVGIERSDGTADADFTSSFRNGYEHDVHDPYASNDERDGRDASEKDLEGSSNARYGGEHVGRTRYREIRFGRIRDLELLEVVVGDGLLRGIHDVGRRCHDDELRDVLIAREAVLHRRDRDVDGVVGTLDGAAAGTLGLGDADDAEIDVADLDVLSEGVCRSKEVGRGRRTENGDLRTRFHVFGGDEHAVLGLDVLNFGIVGPDSVDGGIGIDVADDDLLGRVRDRGDRRDARNLANLLGIVERENIGGFHVSRTDVALAATARTEGEKVRTERFDARRDAPLRAFAERHEHDDRRDADNDAETRKRRAHLIGTDASQRVEEVLENGHGYPITLSGRYFKKFKRS